MPVIFGMTPDYGGKLVEKSNIKEYRLTVSKKQAVIGAEQFFAGQRYYFMNHAKALFLHGAFEKLLIEGSQNAKAILSNIMRRKAC